MPSPSPLVSICVGDSALRHVLDEALSSHGFAVAACASTAETLLALASSDADVLLLDVALPDADGRVVCQALRGAGIDIPVLFLGQSGTLAERLSTFHAGGDDYLARPYATAEVVARVGALHRRRRSDDRFHARR
jgi:two-component system OmpR family response regulator